MAWKTVGNVKGVKGDKGNKGDKGDKGNPGPGSPFLIISQEDFDNLEIQDPSTLYVII